MSKDSLLATAEKVVAYATRHGAEAAEAFVERSRSGAVRIEKNRVGGIESETTYGIGLRVLKGGRVGFAHLTRVDDLASALKDALGAATLAKKLPKFRFADPARFRKIAKIHDPRIDVLEGPDVLELANGMVTGVKEVRASLDVTEAGVGFGAMQNAIANSNGLAGESQETSISASCFVVQHEGGVSTGFASKESTRLDLKTAALGTEAATLALAARNPKKLERPGVRPIILRPEPAADLLSTLTLSSLHGRAAHRGESYYSGKVGKRVAHAKIDLVDDPTLAAGLGSSPYDDEGEASRAVPLLRGGVLKTFLFDRSAAAEFGAKTTASALRVHPFDGRNYKSPPAISARNVRLVAPSTRTAKLIAGVDDGLLVHDMMGVHTANTVSGDFSVTSTVIFRIRKGAVEGPVAPVSVAGNFHATLRQGLTMGDDAKQTSHDAGVEVPSVRVDTFNVTP